MAIRFQSLIARSPQYRADIDGLRAVAVLSVVLFHADAPYFKGGFVGVDIFFVISGYLITSILTKDLDAGKFSFLHFYERRIRRIFPALIAVSLACAVVMSVLFLPHDLVNFGASLRAVSWFASNFYFAEFTRSLGYFASPTANMPLLHTWSLSVEEQFYLFFPVLLLILHRTFRRYRALALVIVAVLSFVYSMHSVVAEPTVAFYALPTRGWELIVGALLAGGTVPALQRRVWRELAGLAGLLLVAYSVLAFDRDTPFPGPHALVPCVGAALLLHSGKAGNSAVKHLLSFRPLVFVGVISYSLYLWHWPIAVACRYFFQSPYFSDLQLVAFALLALSAAFLSFELIESPFRTMPSPFSCRQIFLFGLGGNVILALAGYSLVALNGLPQRYSAETRRLIELNDARRSDWVSTGACVSYMKPLHKYSDATFCEEGHAAKNILLWGDSLAEQIYPVVDRLRREGELHGEGAVFAFGPGCPPLLHENRIVSGYYCDLFSQFALQRAQQDDIDTVFMVFSSWWSDRDQVLCASTAAHCDRTLSGPEVQRRTIEELAGEIRTLQAKGKHVILSLPFPDYTESIPDAMTHNAVFGRLGQARTPRETNTATFRTLEEAMARSLGVTIYDPRATLCVGARCNYAIDGVSIYRDNGHLAATQTGILHDSLVEILHSVR